MVKYCGVTSCGRVVRSKGLCGTHYQQMQRHGKITEEVQRSGPIAQQGCSVEVCDRPYYARGYCRAHHARWSNGSDLSTEIGKTLPKKVVGPRQKCAFGPCDRFAVVHGLCKTHNTQKENGQELRPIKVHRRLTVLEKSRDCTKCGVHKVNSEFYLKGDGKLNSSCKLCYTARTSIRQAQRRGVPVPTWALEHLAWADANLNGGKMTV